MGQSVTSSDTEAQIMAAHPTPISKMTQDSAFPHLIATICQVDFIHIFNNINNFWKILKDWDTSREYERFLKPLNLSIEEKVIRGHSRSKNSSELTLKKLFLPYDINKCYKF